MEMKRKDTEPKVMQPAENRDTECNERPLHSKANKVVDKWELHNQMHIEERQCYVSRNNWSRKWWIFIAIRDSCLGV